MRRWCTSRICSQSSETTAPSAGWPEPGRDCRGEGNPGADCVEAERGHRGAGARREIETGGIAANLVNLSVLLNESLHRPDEALPLPREVLQIRREAGNQNGEALVLNNIGNVHSTKRITRRRKPTSRAASRCARRPTSLAKPGHPSQPRGNAGRNGVRYTVRRRNITRRSTFGELQGRPPGGDRVLQPGHDLRLPGRYERRSPKEEALTTLREARKVEAPGSPRS